MAIHMEIEYVDMHCHCHEITIAELEEQIKNKILIVCVSDDIESSQTTIELGKQMKYLIPCIGIHPWEAHNYNLNDILKIKKIVEEYNIRCLGEIGLDKRFYPQTIEYQRKIFLQFLEIASEYDLFVNLHTAGAWREVYDLLIRYDINKAYFHWYTGPKTLIHDIIDSGYFIGINPAWKIQEKHKRIIEYVPLENILTESDAPYKYRSLYMKPELVIESVEYITKAKNIDIARVKQILLNNYYKVLG